MNRIVVLGVVLAVAGCAKGGSRSETDPGAGTNGASGSAGTTTPPPPPPPAIDAAPNDPRSTPVPRPVPSGPYVVAYDCSHSNMPFGKGGWFKNQSLDLSKLTWTTLEVTTTGDEDSAPPSTPPPPPPQPKISAASPAVAQKIAAAVDLMLGGGPYNAEWPVSEGVPCTLSITTPAGAPVYRIDKAFTNEKDRVNELIALFNASVGK